MTSHLSRDSSRHHVTHTYNSIFVMNHKLGTYQRVHLLHWSLDCTNAVQFRLYSTTNLECDRCNFLTLFHHQWPYGAPSRASYITWTAGPDPRPTSTSKDFEMRLIPMIFVKLWPDQCQEESRCVRLEKCLQ